MSKTKGSSRFEQFDDGQTPHHLVRGSGKNGIDMEFDMLEQYENEQL
jgi:hypothetical protein